MPNHCSNDLFVSGPADEVKRFLEKAVRLADDGGATLNEDFIMPYPEEFKQKDKLATEYQQRFDAEWELSQVQNPSLMYKEFSEKFQANNGPRVVDGFNSGGYEWCNSNWGTKWGSYNGAIPEITKEGKRLKLTFDTAWSPYDNGFFKCLSSLFPALRIVNKFYESGVGYKGHTTWKGGKLLSGSEGTYRGRRGG